MGGFRRLPGRHRAIRMGLTKLLGELLRRLHVPGPDLAIADESIAEIEGLDLELLNALFDDRILRGHLTSPSWSLELPGWSDDAGRRSVP